MYIPENVHRYSHSSEYEYCTPRRVHFFGQFQLFWHDQSLCKLIWRRSKAKTLLQWFLLNPGKLYAAEQLTDLFWNDLDEEAATRNLHVTVHYLRHLLEPDLPLRQESTFLRRNKNNFYWLELDDTWWVDIFDVHHLYTAAIKHDQESEASKAIFRYRKVVNYCSRGFLPGECSEAAFYAHRNQYESIYYQSLVRLILLFLEREELEEVMEYAYQALKLDHCCEIAVKAIALVHYQQNNHKAAIGILDEFQRRLRREFGVGPSQQIHKMRMEMVRRELSMQDLLRNS
jgi:DNA-binding SARP family transcriptional activator